MQNAKYVYIYNCFPGTISCARMLRTLYFSFFFFPQLVKVTHIVISKTSLLLCTNHNLPPLVKFIVSLDFSCVLKSWTSCGKFEFVFFVRILIK